MQITSTVVEIRDKSAVLWLKILRNLL